VAVKDFRDLLIWQKAMELAEGIYRLCQGLPSNEAFGLVSQLRRAAVSIASNIAEGHARQSQREFNRFLLIARGSLAELQTQLFLVERLGYGDGGEVRDILSHAEELGKMIRGMQKTLGSTSPTLDSRLSTPGS